MIPYSKFVQLTPEETFLFECRNCGDCCRKVKGAVMIESLDLFQIARHLGMETSEVANQYTEIAMVAWGAPILVLRTKAIGDVCVFLKSGRCGIQPAKPRACRLYPLSSGLDDDMKGLIILKSSERDFHYTGQRYLAGDWLRHNMDDESCNYVITESRLLREIGQVLRRIPCERENDVNQLMLLYRFLLFDTHSDFMLQYTRNMTKLKSELERIVNY